MATCLVVAYDGAAFHGAARQPGIVTMLGTLQEVLELRRIPVDRLVVAGRTDTGVHARAQVVSGLRDLDGATLDRLARALPSTLALRAACHVDDQFDARRLATWRAYLYRIRRAERDPLAARAWCRPGPLALDAMSEFAAGLMRCEDFAALCKAGAAGGYQRRLLAVVLVPCPGWLDVMVVGESFCHQMVRRLVGVLVEVGTGRLGAGVALDRVAAGDRTRLAYLAPPSGLYLWGVGYHPSWEWLVDGYRRHGFDREWATIDRDALPGPLEWVAECQAE